MTSIPDRIREYANEEMHGMYTISLCKVKKVKHKKRKAEVSLLRDTKIVIDNVPITTTHANPKGFGEVMPVKAGMEGLLFHTKEPLADLIKEKGHNEDVELNDNSFRLKDCAVLPLFWNDNDTKPTENLDYAEGDYLYAHESGTNVWIRGSNSGDKPGTVRVEAEGEVILKADTVKLGNPAKHALNEAAQMNDTFLGLGGGVKDPGSTNG